MAGGPTIVHAKTAPAVADHRFSAGLRSRSVKSSGKVRLDHLVVERGLAESGHKAQALILAGRIRAPGLRATKPGTAVSSNQPLELIEPLRYVSRGGYKLEGAIAHFGLEIKNRVCLDVGASTGGFTDCLLQHGASRVIAVDVGHGQLHWKLRRDTRVQNREKTHVLELATEDLRPSPPSLVTVDVSFISLEKVLPHLSRLVPEGTEFLALVKPQFEAGPRNAPKGVVRNPEVREQIIENMERRLPEWNFQPKGGTPSTLKGPKGNVEHFLYFVKGRQTTPPPAPPNCGGAGTAIYPTGRARGTDVCGRPNLPMKGGRPSLKSSGWNRRTTSRFVPSCKRGRHVAATSDGDDNL